MYRDSIKSNLSKFVIWMGNGSVISPGMDCCPISSGLTTNRLGRRWSITRFGFILMENINFGSFTRQNFDTSINTDNIGVTGANLRQNSFIRFDSKRIKYIWI